MSPHVIVPGHALRLRAMQDLQTASGQKRTIGEEWLVREVGAYLPGVFEEVHPHQHPHVHHYHLVIQIVNMEKAVTLTPKVALHIRAINTYTDQFGRKRYIHTHTHMDTHVDRYIQ